MNPFVDQFRNLTTEALLEKRALGADGLVPEAHAAVEILLRERQVPIPPLPSRPIATDIPTAEPHRSSIARNAVLVAGALVATAVAKQFAVTWVGLLFTAAVGVYILVEWFRRQGLSEAERSAEDASKQVEREGLTELMQSAAQGDLNRVKELVAYREDVNAVSAIGSTALMYAAKNGHAEIVQFLLQAGADASIKTKKGNSAIDLARHAGHQHIVQFLQ